MCWNSWQVYQIIMARWIYFAMGEINPMLPELIYLNDIGFLQAAIQFNVNRKKRLHFLWITGLPVYPFTMELDIKKISLFIVIFSQLILLSECVNSSVIEEIYNSIKSLPEYEQLGKYLYVQWKDHLLSVQWKDHLLAHTSQQMLNLWLFR